MLEESDICGRLLSGAGLVSGDRSDGSLWLRELRDLPVARSLSILDGRSGDSLRSWE